VVDTWIMGCIIGDQGLPPEDRRPIEGVAHRYGAIHQGNLPRLCRHMQPFPILGEQHRSPFRPGQTLRLPTDDSEDLPNLLLGSQCRRNALESLALRHPTTFHSIEAGIYQS